MPVPEPELECFFPELECVYENDAVEVKEDVTVRDAVLVVVLVLQLLLVKESK